MKANELMIGDWVMDGDTPTHVTSITCDGIVETMRRISNIEVIDPIPLTSEILEKNGFELRREKVWRWISEDERTQIRFVLGAEHISIIKNAYYEDEVEFSLPCPNCVHELQHALRLCGIEKDVVL